MRDFVVFCFFEQIHHLENDFAIYSGNWFLAHGGKDPAWLEECSRSGEGE
jgi:hypothetical protein